MLLLIRVHGERREDQAELLTRLFMPDGAEGYMTAEAIVVGDQRKRFVILEQVDQFIGSGFWNSILGRVCWLARRRK